MGVISYVIIPDSSVAFGLRRIRALPAAIHRVSARHTIAAGSSSAGVKISRVNIMTMDYGYQISGKTFGDLAIMSSEKTLAQLKPLLPGASTSQLYGLIGITPMIGKNDDGVVFQVSDASQVAAYAKQKGIAMLSFWAMQRDQVGTGSLGVYSGVNQSDDQFLRTFQTAF